MTEPVRHPALYQRLPLFAHAVNSRSALRAFIQSRAGFAEGDVSMGRIRGRPGERAVMAHPPQTWSDITFAEWADAVLESGRGAKVDMKSRQVVPEVFDRLEATAFPEDHLILNADVFQGPFAEPPAFSLGDLVAWRDRFRDVTISIGCSTVAGTNPYREQDIQSFFTIAREVGGPVTCCLRVQMLLADPSVLAAVREEGYHVTIWNSGRSFPADRAIYEELSRLAPDAFMSLSDAELRPVHPLFASV